MSYPTTNPDVWYEFIHDMGHALFFNINTKYKFQVLNALLLNPTLPNPTSLTNPLTDENACNLFPTVVWKECNLIPPPGTPGTPDAGQKPQNWESAITIIGGLLLAYLSLKDRD